MRASQNLLYKAGRAEICPVSLGTNEWKYLKSPSSLSVTPTFPNSIELSGP